VNDENDQPVFHEGETQIHRSINDESRIADLGKYVIQDHMPDQHREFFAELPWVHLSAIDSQGHPWALTRMGDPGFMSSPDNKTLVIESEPLNGEPHDLQLDENSKISVVGIQFSTLRRNRLNATIRKVSGNQLFLRVDQSYGNCPKYIQKRSVVSNDISADATVSSHHSFDQTDRDILLRADTLFIASRAEQLTDDPRSGVDINHRGGFPGFISIVNHNTLLIPDYSGNNFFNTLGNIVMDSRIGIQLVDFATGTLLNLQGHAEITSADASTLKLPDTGRCLKVTVDKIIRSSTVFPYRLSEPLYSIFLPKH